MEPRWPSTIPYDLKVRLGGCSTTDDRQRAFRFWALYHRLKLKIQWFHGLHVGMSELDRQRAPTADSDRWGVIKEWLESHEVLAPDRLPTEPERNVPPRF